MSIGGDIVSEAIALLQPTKEKFSETNIREYSGELDDMAKDNFVLPSYLYVQDWSPGSSVTEHDSASAILVEFNGVDHEPQDGSNLVYLNTYRVNVWIVYGYHLTTQHKQGGQFLDQEKGYHLYDAVLDLMAGRKLLKDAETIRFIRGERTYFGNLEGDNEAPMTLVGQENCATVYKLEFSIKAQSLWEQFGGGGGYPSLQRDGTKGPGETTDETGRITRTGDPWYIAAGPLKEQGGMSVDMEILVNDAYVDFNERAVQQLPNDRVTWRSVFPKIQLPSAILPCTDEAPTDSGDDHLIYDVVDGYPLDNGSAAYDEILYRRQASGLYAPNYRDLVQYSPRHALEFVTQGESFSVTAHDGLDKENILDPYDPEKSGSDQYITFSGFVAARVRSEGLLISKWDTTSNSNGWKLEIDSAGHVVFTLSQGDTGTIQQVVKINRDHRDEHWFGVLFSVVDAGTGNPTIKLFAPDGYYTDSDSSNASSTPTGSWTGWTVGTEGRIIESPFQLGGAKGQIAFAAYWQGPADNYDVANELNYHYLWRGLINPVNISQRPGLVVNRETTMAWPVNMPLSGGETVAKFVDSGSVVPQDHYTVQNNMRVMPFDRERENLIPFSEVFSNSSWGSALSGVNPEDTGPDGMVSAHELGADQSVQIDTGNAIDVSGHVSTIFSVWAHSENGGSINLTIDAASTEHKLTRKWTRVHVTEGAIAGTIRPQITAVGETISIWGAQLEEGLLEYNPGSDLYGSDPTGYIPTAGAASGEVGIDECYVDWTVLPGPLADRGKVQIALIPGKDMLGAADGSEFAAFQVQPENGTGEYIKVSAVLGSTTVKGETKRTITWNLVGEMGDKDPSFAAPEPVIAEEGSPLTVSVRWHLYGLELWVEGEAVAQGGGEHVFSDAPTRCHLMHNVENVSVSSSANWDNSNWIGACKEVRWWR